MTLYKISERVGKSPAGGPALRANEIRLRSVLRRSGRCSAPLLARFVRAVDWSYVRFVAAYTGAVLVVLHVAMGRA